MPPSPLTIAKLTKPTSGTIAGWVANVRSSGALIFLQVRDGTGVIQAVVAKDAVDAKTFAAAKDATLESSVRITGEVKNEPRSPSGWEMKVVQFELVQKAAEYPIGKKEHGPDFLLDQRHLWLRSEKQSAILRLRDEVVWQLRSWLHAHDFVLTDSPILTPTAAEGTTTLFKTDYFGEPAFLAQTGQLYLEATAMALGRVYDFGPTFRAEKSKTRKHLVEFWMMDAEAAFVDHVGNLEIQEHLIADVIAETVKARLRELEILGRDVSTLAKITAPFPRLTYDEAVARLIKQGSKIKLGDDFGAPEEELISQDYDQPVFIEFFPTTIKAFYMQPHPDHPERVLCADLIAPEGFGEIIGGSQRIDDYELLKKRLREWKLKESDYAWYLDLRKYGSVPHSGFGIGLERLVRWIGGIEHIREAIPFPRLLNRLRP
ncbi:MAG: asparagine--tRNA ligase [Candidatus Kerfeldbacteria bacterium]|nr:asparagine--tRNA ligase [Candidatus Kerfeldbacteria bacterium]